MKTARTVRFVFALKALSLLLLLVGITAFGISSVHAEGGAFYSGTHNWGTVLGAPGSANFSFGGNGGVAQFQGNASTVNGNSGFNGVVGFSASSFVPQGTFGTAQASGFINHSIDASHFGGAANVNQFFSGGTNSSSTGFGSSNASINFNQGGNSSWNFGGKGG